MRIDPLGESPLPSGGGLAKRRKGQQKNRDNISLPGSVIDYSIQNEKQGTDYGKTLCRLCGKEFQKSKKEHYYCLPVGTKRSCRLIHQDRKKKKPLIYINCALCGKKMTTTRKDWRFCGNPCNTKLFRKKNK